MLTRTQIRPFIADVIARNAVSIPPYPANAMRLRNLVSSGAFGLADLARLVKEDQVLAAAVLRAANSAMFRRSDAVTTLDRAVSHLGADEVCRVALSASLGKIAVGHGALAEMRRTAWRHALTSAICAGHLGYGRNLNSETAFVCALLHDFGRVVGVAALEEVMRSQKITGTMPAEEWTLLIDEVHVELGLLIGARWKLSDVILECIGCHHSPENATEHRPFVDVITACDGIVALLDDCPYLLPHDLQQIPGIRGSREAHALMEALPLIPAYITRLADVMPDTGFPVTSQIEKPSSQLTEGRRRGEWPTAWVRSTGDTACTLEFLTGDGLSVICKEALPEGGVARMRVGEGPHSLEVSGRVLLTAALAGQHRSEIRLFVIPGVGKAAWESLYLRADAAA